MFTNLATQLADDHQRQMLAEASQRQRHQHAHLASAAPRAARIICMLAAAITRIGAGAAPAGQHAPACSANRPPPPRPPIAAINDQDTRHQGQSTDPVAAAHDYPDRWGQQLRHPDKNQNAFYAPCTLSQTSSSDQSRTAAPRAGDRALTLLAAEGVNVAVGSGFGNEQLAAGRRTTEPAGIPRR